MAISSEARSAGPFIGTGSETEFPFSFKILSADHVKVVLSKDGGATEEEVSKTSFSVGLNADQDNNPGGKVTLNSKLGSGERLSVISDAPYLQPMVLTNRGGFYPETLNDSADNIVIQTQQLKEELTRAVKVPSTSADTPEQILKDIFDTQANAHASATAAANSAAASAASASTSKEYADKVTAFKGEIVTTAQNISSVKTTAQNVTAINDVADNAANITTVAGNIGSVQSVASDIAGVVAVAKNEANVNAVAANIDQVAAIGEEARQSQVSAKASADSARASEGLALTYKNEAVFARNETQSIASGVASLDGSGVAQTVLDLIALLGVTGVDTGGEYMLAFTDAEGRLLFWIDGEGNVGWTKGVSKPVQEKLDNLQAQITAHQGEYDALVTALASANARIDDVNNRLSTGVDPNNPEWLKAWTDSEGRLLGGFRTDGSFEHVKGVPSPVQVEIDSLQTQIDSKVDKVDGKSLIDEVYADAQSTEVDHPEYLAATVDGEGKLLEGTTIDGKKVFGSSVDVNGTLSVQHVEVSDEAKTELRDALESIGFSAGKADWSGASEVQIPMPRCAYVNVISDYESMPTSKTANQKVWLEFWDLQGNYFKKRVILNAQGASSMSFVKKNAAFDICNDEWIGDDTFSLKIGDWVPQDSFHLKAYYTDYFRGVAVISYQLMNDVLRTRGLAEDRTWKKALIDQSTIGPVANGFTGLSDHDLELDTGARCFPDGFPCILFFNESFYGIFSWQLKKHRDNMHQSKKTAEHIHLDGDTNSSTLFNVQGSSDFVIQWSKFEIRNPKNLYCMDGSAYEADKNQKELIDATSSYYDSGNADHVRSAKVKQYILNLSMSMYYVNKARADHYSGNHTAEGAAIVRAEFEKYFDPDNWIDYLVVSDIVKNADGFGKNWQWATWDGVHWYVNIYDVDMSFGGHFDGNQITAPLTSHISTNKSHPTGFITEFYSSAGDFGTGDLEARYAELRKAKIFDAETLVEKLNDWTKRIGTDNFEKEYRKWPDCPCHGANVIDTAHWAIVKDPEGNFVMAGSKDYDAERTYAVGERCTYGISAAMGYYTFDAVAQTTGNAPISQFKYLDSIYRVKKWLDQEIANMDKIYNYSGE